MITVEDRLNYLKLKDSEEFTVEDLGYVFCYGKLEDYSLDVMIDMVSLLEPAVDFGQKRMLLQTSDMVRFIIGLLGEEGFVKRLMGLIPDFVRLEAEDIARNSREVDFSGTNIFHEGRFYVNSLINIIYEYIPMIIKQEYLEDMRETFKDTFKNNLPEDLEGVGNYYASMMVE